MLLQKFAFICAGLGILLTALGAFLAAKGVIVSDEDATSLATAKWDLNPELKQNLLRQSRLAVWGLGLVVVGSGFQFVAVVLSYLADR
jgi:hypothetical protein